MFPVLLHLGATPVHTYFLMAAVAFLVAMGLGAYLGRREGYEVETILDLLLIIVFASFLGARLVFVATEWDHFSANLGEIPQFWKGGLVWYGGPLLTIPLCILYGIHKQMPVGAGCDIAAVCIPLGHMFGRIGCLGYGCCFGAPSGLPWAVPFPGHAPDSLPRHPTQAYEAVGLLLLWVFLMRQYSDLAKLGRSHPFRGRILGLYFAGYAILRFLVETVRDDPRGPMVFLSVSQWISIGVLVLGLAVLRWTCQAARAS